jgi:stress-induced morphogen
MIFEALDDLMKTDIHALRVFASPPEPKRQPSTTKDVHENSSS